jgi:hypothetical protein
MLTQFGERFIDIESLLATAQHRSTAERAFNDDIFNAAEVSCSFIFLSSRNRLAIPFNVASYDENTPPILMELPVPTKNYPSALEEPDIQRNIFPTRTNQSFVLT